MKFAQVRGNSAPVQRIVQEFMEAEGISLLNGKLSVDSASGPWAQTLYPEFRIKVENKIWQREGQMQQACLLTCHAYHPHREAWMLVAAYRDECRHSHRAEWTGINWCRLRQEYYARKACRQALRDEQHVLSTTLKWNGEVVEHRAALPVGGMVLGAGVRTYEEAVRFIKVWPGACDRPDTFGSSFNPDPKWVMDWIRATWACPTWVTQVMVRMGQQTHYPIERLGNHRELFDAAKAWKLNVLFWKDVAVRVGKLPLWKRLVAAEVLNALARETDVTFMHGRLNRESLAWKSWQSDRSLRIAFWLRFNDAVKPGMTGALAQWARHSTGNVKRLMGLLHGKTLTPEQATVLTGVAKAPALVGLKTGQWVNAVEAILTHTHNGCCWKTLTQSWSGYWHPLACVGLVAVFGKQWQRWLEKQENLERGAHDAVYWLPASFSPLHLKGLDGFLFRHGERPIEELEVISGNWPVLTEEERQLPFQTVLGLCRSRKYAGVESEIFAQEAAKWGTSDKDYTRFERVYLQSLKVPTPFDPNMRWEQGGYVARFLPREDPRVGFFGNYTNCCQNWTGVGKACAISSVADSFSQLFVIEQNGAIIAGSWVWEAVNRFGEDAFRVACFDNVEAKGLSANQHNLFAELYQQAGEWIAGQGYKKVTIGSGTSDLNLNRWNSTTPLTLPSQYSGHTDAGSQVLVVQNLTALSIRKNQEKVWVRGALEADFENAAHVAEACYPKGYQYVSMPDGEPRGMMLMHQSAGVIGYAAWDAELRYVSDIAVLPGFRRYAPRFIEALATQWHDGEWWNGEFRASTSLRSLQRYAERGVVEFEDFGIAHELEEGDPCHSVRFRVL